MLEMDEHKNFRISVDLSAFFYDHRRVARIFVKRNLKKIVDLQNRISEIFEISEFYLTTGGHFLPASEDVRVLNNNESVCVIPKKPQEIGSQSAVTSSTQQIKFKKQKRALEVIPEDSGEISTPKKKKSARKHAEVASHTTSDSEGEVPRKKKKSENNENTKSSKKKNKHKNHSADLKHSDGGYDNESVLIKKPNKSIVEREICHFESNQKIIDVKKKLKQKTDEYISNHSKSAHNSINTASNIKNVLPKLQSHIKNCNDLGRSTLPDTVRLSRHVDTPIKTFRHYTPPQRITDEYLAKNKINIVKVDIVNIGSEEVNEQANLSQNSASTDNAAGVSNGNLEKSITPQILEESYSSQKNYVKQVINSFEKSLSPELKSSTTENENNGVDGKILEIKKSEASNYTKAFLDQGVATGSDISECNTVEPVNVAAKSMDVVDDTNDTNNSNTILNGSVQASLNNEQFSNPVDLPTVKPLNEAIESTDMSMNISSIANDSSYLSEYSKDSSLNTTNTSLQLTNSSAGARNTISNKILMGIGTLLENLRESDSLISHESDSSSQYVTKRKRTRRKRSKKNDEQKSAPLKIETYVEKPMNVKACPKIHIKFEDNQMEETLEQKSLTVADINNKTVVENCNMEKGVEVLEIVNNPVTSDRSENKSFAEMVTLSDEDDPIMENKSIFGEESISRAPLMTNKIEPKVGDVIAFKILKITEDYTPQVSNYIVGKLEVLWENKIVGFKILHGEDELLPPTGKLSLKDDTYIEDSKYKEFSWTELIAPKLLYP